MAKRRKNASGARTSGRSRSSPLPSRQAARATRVSHKRGAILAAAAASVPLLFRPLGAGILLRARQRALLAAKQTLRFAQRSLRPRPEPPTRRAPRIRSQPLRARVRTSIRTVLDDSSPDERRRREQRERKAWRDMERAKDLANFKQRAPLTVCDIRAMRREVLFATGGTSGPHRRKRFTSSSNLSCK